MSRDAANKLLTVLICSSLRKIALDWLHEWKLDKETALNARGKKLWPNYEDSILCPSISEAYVSQATSPFHCDHYTIRASFVQKQHFYFILLPRGFVQCKGKGRGQQKHNLGQPVISERMHKIKQWQALRPLWPIIAGVAAFMLPSPTQRQGG